MHFEQVLAATVGTIFGFGLLFQAVSPAAVAAPTAQRVVVAQTADGAAVVTEDDPWH